VVIGNMIVGLFVGLTAFFGGFMNWNFIMAGSVSVNGVFFGLSVLLVLAWKIAG
jgi:thiosulfate dehydrogenase [quinone] large subunit